MSQAQHISGFLGRLSGWAASRKDIRAVALVGSWARAGARPDSDVDVIVLTDNPAQYIENVDWPVHLGLSRVVRTRSWGAITEQRATLPGIEIEFGIGTAEWAATRPVDPGTRRVASDGLVILYDPEELLADLLRDIPEKSHIPFEVKQIAERLTSELHGILGNRLLAVYLFGSATTGAYEPAISDVDTVAVLRDDLTDDDIASLGALHERIVREAPTWNDRIEVDYLSAMAIADFRSHPWPAARVSPGELFHRIQIDRRWLLDWYQVRSTGITLYGRPPEEIVPEIPQSEFVDAVREQLAEWPDRLANNTTPGRLAYVVLTLCRAFRACTTGDNVSKKEAAVWAAGKLPDFAGVINDAIAWRYADDTGSRRAPDPTRALQLCKAVQDSCSGSR
jgi:predicted nucleotidyltransferase